MKEATSTGLVCFYPDLRIQKQVGRETVPRVGVREGVEQRPVELSGIPARVWKAGSRDESIERLGDSLGCFSKDTSYSTARQHNRVPAQQVQGLHDKGLAPHILCLQP